MSAEALAVLRYIGSGNFRLPQTFSSLSWFWFVGAMTRSLTLGFRVLGIELVWS